MAELRTWVVANLKSLRCVPPGGAVNIQQIAQKFIVHMEQFITKKEKGKKKSIKCEHNFKTHDTMKPSHNSIRYLDHSHHSLCLNEIKITNLSSPMQMSNHHVSPHKVGQFCWLHVGWPSLLSCADNHSQRPVNLGAHTWHQLAQ